MKTLLLALVFVGVGMEVLVGCVVVHDFNVAVASQFSTQVAVKLIEEYREHVSPHLKGRIVCRFRPTCSLYGMKSVQKYGAVKGSWRALARIARCTRATPRDTYDPPD